MAFCTMFQSGGVSDIVFLRSASLNNSHVVSCTELDTVSASGQVFRPKRLCQLTRYNSQQEPLDRGLDDWHICSKCYGSTIGSNPIRLGSIPREYARWNRPFSDDYSLPAQKWAQLSQRSSNALSKLWREITLLGGAISQGHKVTSNPLCVYRASAIYGFRTEPSNCFGQALTTVPACRNPCRGCSFCMVGCTYDM